MIISHMGEVLEQGSETEPETISATIEPTLAKEWRNEFNVLGDLRRELIGVIKVTRIKA
jgi:predicted amidohydrolase